MNYSITNLPPGVTLPEGPLKLYRMSDTHVPPPDTDYILMDNGGAYAPCLYALTLQPVAASEPVQKTAGAFSRQSQFWVSGAYVLNGGRWIDRENLLEAIEWAYNWSPTCEVLIAANPPQPSPPVDDREAFEEWALSPGGPGLNRKMTSETTFEDEGLTIEHWKAWLAARGKEKGESS